MKPLPPEHPPGIGPLSCCVCLNPSGKKVPAVWVTDAGYCLCEQHKDIDVLEMIAAVWRKGTAV